MNYFSSLLIIGLTFSSVSCSQKLVKLSPILNTNQCGFSQKQLIYIQSNEQLQRLFTQSFNNPIKSLDKINFNEDSLILVSMGQHPSAGYSIQLNSAKAKIKNNILIINAFLKTPKSNSYNAQVMTSPCALYKIKKQLIHSIELTN